MCNKKCKKDILLNSNYKDLIEEKFKDFIVKYLDEDGYFLGEKICGNLEFNDCEDCEFDCRKFLFKVFKEEVLN